MSEVEKKKGSKTLIYVLAGCGVLFVLGIVAAGAFLFLGKKFYKFASKPEEAIAKVITANNPDIEVISIDQDNKKVTIRNKKTGEVMDIDFSDAKKGIIQWKGKGGNIKIASEEKEGKLEISSEEGQHTITYGKDLDIPKWVPIPSGFNIINQVSNKSDEGLIGTIEFDTDMSFDEAKKSIEKAIKEKGLKYSITLSQESEDKKQTLMQGGKEEENRSIFVMLIKEEDKIKCTLNYNEKAK